MLRFTKFLTQSQRSLILALALLVGRIDGPTLALLPGVPLAVAGFESSVRALDTAGENKEVVLAMALGGVGWFATGWYNSNWWHTDWWAEAGAGGGSPVVAGGVTGITSIRKVTSIC